MTKLKLTPERALTLISLVIAAINLATTIHHHAAALKRKRRVHAVIGIRSTLGRTTSASSSLKPAKPTKR